MAEQGKQKEQTKVKRFCRQCDEVQPHSYGEVEGFSDKSLTCDLCRNDWENDGQLIAKGYEFTCPFCGKLNDWLIEIPSDMQMACKHCGELVDFPDYKHAFE